MAKLFGSKSAPAPVEDLLPIDGKAEKGMLHFHGAEKFLASFFAFSTEAPKEKGRRLLASMVARNAKFCAMPNADEVLRVLLPTPFVDDAKKAGWTLKESIEHATAIIEARKSEKVSNKPKPADEDLKLLCSLLVNVRAEVSPRELLDELKQIIAAKGEDAVNYLDELAKRDNPRDKKGFLYLRTVKTK